MIIPLISLLLCFPQERSWTKPPPVPTFQLMLDSAYVVVIAKVDTIWYSTTGKGDPLTNIRADVISVYAKNDSLDTPTSSIHILKSGGVCPDGTVVESLPSPSFEIGEVFLAAVEKYPNSSSEMEAIYHVPYYWKYTIAKDTIRLNYIKYEPFCISLGEALMDLSLNFIQKIER